MNYTIKLSRTELDSLAWVGDRYESAGILYDALQLTSDDDPKYFANRYDKTTEFTWNIPEHILWEYREVIPSDWGCSDPADCKEKIPPCIGGRLAEKLENLYDEIV